MDNNEKCIELLEELLKYDILRYQHKETAEALVEDYRENEGKMSVKEFMEGEMNPNKIGKHFGVK